MFYKDSEIIYMGFLIFFVFLQKTFSNNEGDCICNK